MIQIFLTSVVRRDGALNKGFKVNFKSYIILEAYEEFLVSFKKKKKSMLCPFLFFVLDLINKTSLVLMK